MSKHNQDAANEIQSLSLNARSHLTHLIRGHLQEIATHAEPDASPHGWTEKDKLKAISDIIMSLDVDLRKWGL